MHYFILDSTTAVMAGPSWESQSHMSQYRQRVISAPRVYPDVTTVQINVTSPPSQRSLVDTQVETGQEQDISDDLEYAPPDDEVLDVSAGQVAPEVAADIEVYTHPTQDTYYASYWCFGRRASLNAKLH